MVVNGHKRVKAPRDPFVHVTLHPRDTCPFVHVSPSSTWQNHLRDERRERLGRNEAEGRVNGQRTAQIAEEVGEILRVRDALVAPPRERCHHELDTVAHLLRKWCDTVLPPDP